MNKYVDKLHYKAQTGRVITLDEACYVLYAQELVYHRKWSSFKNWASKITTGKHSWPTWKAMYVGWDAGGFYEVEQAKIISDWEKRKK